MSGAWSPCLASNGYKTNNTSQCGTASVKFSASCRPEHYFSTHGSFWVR